MCFDGDGNSYVAVYVLSGQGTIRKVTPNGTVIPNWAIVGTGDHSKVMDAAGNIYTANSSRYLFTTNQSANSISKITLAGEVTQTLGETLKWLATNMAFEGMVIYTLFRSSFYSLKS